jgi:hypothetical protein
MRLRQLRLATHARNPPSLILSPSLSPRQLVVTRPIEWPPSGRDATTNSTCPPPSIVCPPCPRWESNSRRPGACRSGLVRQIGPDQRFGATSDLTGSLPPAPSEGVCDQTCDQRNWLSSTKPLTLSAHGIMVFLDVVRERLIVDLREIIHAAEDQGWRIEETTNGLMFYPPDRSESGVLVHRKPSEQGLKKTVSQMRRRDFIWPLPRLIGESDAE